MQSINDQAAVKWDRATFPQYGQYGLSVQTHRQKVSDYEKLAEYFIFSPSYFLEN